MLSLNKDVSNSYLFKSRARGIYKSGLRPASGIVNLDGKAVISIGNYILAHSVSQL